MEVELEDDMACNVLMLELIGLECKLLLKLYIN